MVMIDITIRITRYNHKDCFSLRKTISQRDRIAQSLQKGYGRGNLHNRIHKVFILIYKVTDITKQETNKYIIYRESADAKIAELIDLLSPVFESKPLTVSTR